MELELKHLAPYLPYGLKFEHVEYDYSDKVNHNITKMESLSADLITFEDCSDYYFDADNCDGYNPTVVPLLLPMSSLYTEMEDGKVPIVELAKICYQKAGYNAIVEDGKCYVVNNQNAKIYRFCYDQSHKSFYSMTLFVTSEWRAKVVRYCEDRDTGVHNQLDLFIYLFENHFDVFGLIDKGLALDKTKIK